ncbi:P-loop containing nucleoside triphosphate hydrolase protein [Pisolithus thermaeus]|nr:P-loop containing nucleoside triphosphate hydrolase protein [Pisolithus croceorrhizus]KAI6156263.1 P-loop containing nucleoside triphosphate hydrolase protein [Pisolithus thermaeus]
MSHEDSTSVGGLRKTSPVDEEVFAAGEGASTATDSIGQKEQTMSHEDSTSVGGVRASTADEEAQIAYKGASIASRDVSSNDVVTSANDGVTSVNDGVISANDGLTSANNEATSANDGVTSPNDGVTSPSAGVTSPNAGGTSPTDGKTSHNNGGTSHNDGGTPAAGKKLLGADELEYDMLGLDQVTEKDIIIALMGPTGAGKSSFIANAKNHDKGVGHDEGVGHDLTSFTSDIKATKLEFEKSSVVLVDTPGFNDTKKSDLDILNLISDWLNAKCQGQTSRPILSAILYFHRISDNRMAGTPLKNLRVFEKLCGENAMSKVTLVTTMWDEVDDDVGAERLKELKDTYWRAMILQGSTTFECKDARGSPMELLQQIVQRKEEQGLTRRESKAASQEVPWQPKKLSRLRAWVKKALTREAEVDILLQEEISALGREIQETAAGRQLYSRLEELAQKRMETLRKIREETKRADEKTAEDLWREYNEVRNQLDSTLAQARELKMNFGQQAMNILRTVSLKRK